MTNLQVDAVSPPLTEPGLGTLAARLLSYGATMDLLDRFSPVVTLNYDTLLEAATTLSAATGIGRTTVVKLREKGAQEPPRLGELLRELYQELEESPAPNVEWRPVANSLGSELLTDLLGISQSSLERYESNQRRTPDETAERLHFLALTLSDLAGAYNQFGVRRWFDRPRTLLNGKSPRRLLSGDWNPGSKPARQIRGLAASLSSSVAT